MHRLGREMQVSPAQNDIVLTLVDLLATALQVGLGLVGCLLATDLRGREGRRWQQ